ncbi:MAG: YraN family protein [Pseudomonadota bacterium]
MAQGRPDANTARHRSNTYERGVEAEDMAARHLEARGYRVMARRARFQGGEIDLVARSGNLIAFVEVKRRRSLSEGAHAVTARQQKRIVTAALGWLGANPGHDTCDLRFDVIVLAPDRKSGHMQIEHFEHAFTADGYEAG